MAAEKVGVLMVEGARDLWAELSCCARAIGEAGCWGRLTDKGAFWGWTRCC